ncbi:hypothetical protein JTB14_031094 [Gonioctena quinquepunctata]|nr:hypothetical protein JTB14_031094 [Gonioctena quinquepunctata]
METDKDEDEYTPIPDNNDLEDEYFNYLASSDDELMSEESNWSNQGTYMGQTFTPPHITGGEEHRSENNQKTTWKSGKNPEGEKGKNTEEETLHIFPIVTVMNDPVDVQGDSTSSESGNESDANPGTTEGNEATKDYL